MVTFPYMVQVAVDAVNTLDANFVALLLKM
jgi:hypothetical protein